MKPLQVSGDLVLVETMPDCWRDSHRLAGTWGHYPGNGAVREWMTSEDAEQTVQDDPDGYARIVTDVASR